MWVSYLGSAVKGPKDAGGHHFEGNPLTLAGTLVLDDIASSCAAVAAHVIRISFSPQSPPCKHHEAAANNKGCKKAHQPVPVVRRCVHEGHLG